MKIIKTFESYDSDEINALDHFGKIVDLLDHKGKSLQNVDIEDGTITYNKNKTITLDKYGNVKINSGVLSKIIGRIQLNTVIDNKGIIKNFHFYDFKYNNGDEIKLGDNVIVDDEYKATIDGFSDGKLMVIDQDENIFYVLPNKLKKD